MGSTWIFFGRGFLGAGQGQSPAVDVVTALEEQGSGTHATGSLGFAGCTAVLRPIQNATGSSNRARKSGAFPFFGLLSMVRGRFRIRGRGW
jgi:hypothetical protein